MKRPTQLLASALLLGSFALGACSAWADAKPVVRTADDLAQQACALFFGQKMGISPEDAFRAYCAARKDFAPFIDPVLAAEQQGGTLALEARSK